MRAIASKAGRSVAVAVIAAAASAVAISYGSGLWAKPNGVGEVTHVEGAADRAAGKAAFAALAKGSLLQQGDRLRTKAKSRLEAKLSDGSILRLGPSSEMVLSKVEVDAKNAGKKKVEAKVVFGRMWAKVRTLFGEDSSFEVATTNAVAGVRGTRFAAEVDGKGSTTVKVYDGKVLISNKPIYQQKGATKATRVQVAGPQEVSKKQWDELMASAMQMVQVGANGEMSPVQSFAMAEAQDDGWEAWNEARDAQSE